MLPVRLPTVDDIPRKPIAIRLDAKVLSRSRQLFLNDWNRPISFKPHPRVRAEVRPASAIVPRFP
jgi:hypothetical protein